MPDRVGQNERMRLLMTTDAVGGVWRYAIDLIAGLAETDVAIVLAILGPSPSPAQRREAAAIAGLTLIETGLPLDWTAVSPAETKRASERIAALAAEHAVDIVHLNAAALAADVIFPAPVLVVHHSCVATWWAAVRGGAMPDDFRWRSDLVARGLAKADAVVAPTASLAAMTADAYRLNPPLVVHNGSPPRTLARRLEAAAGDAAFTAGRLWDEAKNIATLDAAAARCEARILAAGPLVGPNGARIFCRHLTPLGELTADAVQSWLERQPIYVSPALYEPFGLAVLEAAQAGCALVLSDIPTFRELWQGAAVFVPPRDAGALATTIDDVRAQPQLRAELAEAARTRALNYPATSTVSKMLALYRRLAPSHVRSEAAA